MSLANQILKILLDKGEMRASDLAEETGVSRQMVHRVISRLLASNQLVKLGSPPKTFYKISSGDHSSVESDLSQTEIEFIQTHYLLITETGIKLNGLPAMHHWCNRQKLPLDKTIQEYIKTRKKYLAYFKSNGLISGNEKLRNTKGFQKIGLVALWYLDFYAIERFGKTNLGLLLHFAKQGQNRRLMNEIIDLTKDRIRDLISKEKIEAVGYIPPTIKREVQIMNVLKKGFNLPLPHIDILKITGEIAIPQKALNKIEDRISNAQVSIVVPEKRTFNRVLLIDDAVGSGATLNETANKLLERKIAKEVIGLAITGSFKGFDVIQEV